MRCLVKSKKYIKIIIPLVMVLIVAAIWLISNSGETNSSDADLEFPLNVTELDLSTLTEHELPIIIDFGANECIPCKEMAPVLVELNEEMQGKAIIQFVDVWVNPELANGLPIQLIPSQVLINSDGTPYIPSENVMNQIAFTTYANNETGQHVLTIHQGALTEDDMRLILDDMGVS